MSSQSRTHTPDPLQQYTTMCQSSPPPTPKPEPTHLASSTGINASMNIVPNTSPTTLTPSAGRKSPNRTFVAPAVPWPTYRPISPSNDEADKVDEEAERQVEEEEEVEEAPQPRPKRTVLRIPSPVFSLSPSVWRAALESSPHMRPDDVPSLTRSSSMESMKLGTTPSYEAMEFELNVLSGQKFCAPSPSPVRANERRKVRTGVRQVKNAPLPRGSLVGEAVPSMPKLPVSLQEENNSPAPSTPRGLVSVRGRTSTPFPDLPPSSPATLLPATPNSVTPFPDDPLTPYPSRDTHLDINPSFPTLHRQPPRGFVARSVDRERRSRFREHLDEEVEVDSLVVGREEFDEGRKGGKEKIGWRKKVGRGCRKVLFCSSEGGVRVAFPRAL
jgi:hypothetical protein